MKKRIPQWFIIGLGVIAVCLSLSGAWDAYKQLRYGSHLNPLTLNMANTVEPILTKMMEDACGYANVQGGSSDGWAKGGKLIYKREPVGDEWGGCIGTGNQYYARCYDWQWRDKNLFYKPTHDVKLPYYSCIKEDEIDIPYADERLRMAELGVEYKANK